MQATNIDQKLKDETEEKIILLELEMKELIAKMEACGEEGRVAEAEELNLHVDRLRFEIERLRHVFQIFIFILTILRWTLLLGRNQ